MSKKAEKEQEALALKNEALLKADVAVWQEGFKKLTGTEMEALDRLLTYEKELNLRQFIKFWDEEYTQDESKSFEENYKEFRLHMNEVLAKVNPLKDDKA
tara:strand:- start:213 stop:512 length:300 start_codon:yes stop_codon:yes gene_type:complete